MNEDVDKKKNSTNTSSDDLKSTGSNRPTFSSDANNADDKYKPSLDKFKAEQEAIKESLKPKDYFELQYKDPNILEDPAELDQIKPKPLKNVNQKMEPLNVDPESTDSVEQLEPEVAMPSIDPEISEVNNNKTVDITNVNKINTAKKLKEDTLKTSAKKLDKKAPQKAKIAILEDDDTKMFCGLCHLCNLLIVTLAWVPFFIYIGKADNAKIKFQAVQAILFGLLAFGSTIFLSSVSFYLMNFCIGCFLMPLVVLFALACWGYAVVVTVKCFKGENFRIPYIDDLADYVVRFLNK